MMEIRSYRRVFDLERRLYRVDRLRLNPGGVPVRGIVYFLALLSAAVIAGSLPLIGAVPRGLPWYLRDLALPAASATLLSVIRVEGRPFHLAARALIRYRIGARRLAGLRACPPPIGGRWWPNEIVVLPDGSDRRMRRLRYTGPGAVLIAVEHERAGRMLDSRAAGARLLRRRPCVTVRELPQARCLKQGQVISLGLGVRLLVQTNTTAGHE